MAGIFGFIFGGKYPSTSKYEKAVDKRASEYKRYLDFNNSAVFKRFNELDELVHTGEFEKRVHILKNEKFKNTEAYRKFQDYKSLLGNTEIKDYLSFISSGKADRLKRVLDSKNYKEYQDLQVIVNSLEFNKLKSEKGFKSTEQYRQLLTFKKLKKDSDIKFALKAMNSVQYKNYKSLLGSDKIKLFDELKNYVTSPQFSALKKEIEDPKRYKKSEEYKLVSEFETVSKNSDLLWFQKMKSTNAFANDAQWELTFDEDFDRAQLNGAKWITGYYWGKALLNDNYVLANEKQYFKPSNIDIRESVAYINTKPEHCKGKVWDAARGFLPAEFEYSSALISTGQSFRQKYGRFEAKVKLNHNQPLTHNFWMVGENATPHIDIFRYGTGNSKNITAAVHSLKNNKLEQNQKNIGGAAFNSDYYIYSLEWTPSKLTWKINGVEVHSQTNNIPNQMMYIVFSSNMTETPEKPLQSSMAIDWVRCYQHKDNM